MQVAIHQPNFLPWIGYFHKISLVDTFVFLDDVQFERGKTYTQRAKILLDQDEKWITIPIVNKSDLVFIKDAEVDSSFVWKRKILKSLEINYSNRPGFNDLFPIIQNSFSVNSKYLIDYNIPLIVEISKYLELKTKFVYSSHLDLPLHVNGKDKILEINRVLMADAYLSGMGEGSMRYIVPDEYISNKINLKWQEFQFREYPQYKSKTFIKGLSIIDLIFNCAKDSVTYL